MLAGCNDSKPVLKNNSSTVYLDANNKAKISFQTDKGNKYEIIELSKNKKLVSSKAYSKNVNKVVSSLGKLKITVYKNSKKKSKIITVKPTKKPKLEFKDSIVNSDLLNTGVFEYDFDLKISKGSNYRIESLENKIIDEPSTSSSGKWQEQSVYFGYNSGYSLEKTPLKIEPIPSQIKIVYWTKSNTKKNEKIINLEKPTNEQLNLQLSYIAHNEKEIEKVRAHDAEQDISFDKLTAKNKVEEMHSRIDDQDGISSRVNYAVNSGNMKLMKKELTVVKNVITESNNNKISSKDYSTSDQIYIDYYNDFWNTTSDILKIEKDYLNYAIDDTNQKYNFGSELKSSVDYWNAVYDELMK